MNRFGPFRKAVSLRWRSENFGETRGGGVLIAEDDPEVRSLFRAQVQTIPGFEVVGLALDEQRAVSLCNELDPEIVVIGLDDQRLIHDAVTEVRNNCPRVKVLVVTGASAHGVHADGADAVIARPLAPDEFVGALLELADAG